MSKGSGLQTVHDFCWHAAITHYMCLTDIEQVKNAKKSFTFRWMLRQITLADSGKGQ
jgi:hypothetical protein